MRFSELSTERALDVLCELTPHIANITGDKELVSILKETLDIKNASVAEIFVAGTERLAQIIPIILKNHKADVFEILGVLSEKSVAEIAGQNIIVTMTQIKGMTDDKELMDFFKSLHPQEQTE